MLARRAEAVGVAAVAANGHDLAVLGLETQLVQPPVRGWVAAEGDDPAGAGALGMGAHPGIVLVVAVEDRDPARLQALEDLALGVRDRLHRRERTRDGPGPRW